MEKHYLQLSSDCELFCTKTVTYKYSEGSTRCRPRFGLLTAVAVVFMTSYLLACGDVEPNPGPLGSPEKTVRSPSPSGANDTDNTNTAEHINQLPDRHQNTAEDNVILRALDAVVKRLEDKQESSTARLEKNMHDMEGSLSAQLRGMEVKQQKLQSTVSDLQIRCSELQAENSHLYKKLDTLDQKCDSLENHSRRNNLLFFGLEKGRGFERWEDCEEKVKEVIRDGIGITEEIMIERAHRTGKEGAIVVKLLSFKQKTMILNKARKLKDSVKFRKVFVREDFSTTVRRKRKGLVDKAKQLSSAGQKSKLRFDKLITNDGVYTYDLEREEVTRLSGRDREETREVREEREENVTEGAGGGGGDQYDRRELWHDWNYDPFGFHPPETNQHGQHDTFSGSQFDRQSASGVHDTEYRNQNQANAFKATASDTHPCTHPVQTRTDWLSRDTPLSGSESGHAGLSMNARARLSSGSSSSRIPMRVERSPVRLRQRPNRPRDSDNKQPKINTALQQTTTPQNKDKNSQNESESRERSNSNVGRGGGKSGRGTNTQR